MGTHVEAPASRQDQPTALAHLDDVLELARREEPAWPEGIAELRRSGALLNLGEDDDDTGKEEEPNPDDDHSQDGNQGADEETESFTDFDLDSLPPEARRAAEAAEKRMQADYTRKTQELSQRSQEAGQYEAIVRGLEDPNRAPEILRILDIELPGGEEDDWLLDDDDLYEDDVNSQRLEDLERRLEESEQVGQQRQIEDAEDQQVAQEIEAWEKEHDFALSPEEIAFVYVYADEFRGEDGAPGGKAAIDLLEGIVAGRQSQWIESKKAPRRMPKGKAASRQVDLSTETQEERVKRMAAAAEAARGSGQ
ncbi:MAG TPA: hypothetical protein VF245_12715 [Solirubrobacterales bacterium]